MKQLFQNFESFLANWALKFKKIANMTQKLFFAKFEYRYQNSAENYTDCETVEKNSKNLLIKKLQAKKGEK